MGLKDWINRKIESTRLRNEAKHAAIKDMYTSEEYKKEIQNQEIAKLRENKGNPTGEWLRRVSKNAANNLSQQRVRIDKDKLFGKR